MCPCYVVERVCVGGTRMLATHVSLSEGDRGRVGQDNTRNPRKNHTKTTNNTTHLVVFQDEVLLQGLDREQLRVSLVFD